MNLVSVIGVISCILSMTHAQTPVTNSYCPTGEYYGYKASTYGASSTGVTLLAGNKYSSGGFFAVTAANGADQCCYNCRTQTSGTCTTWTYDGCGRCYLSTATGSGNYLTTASATTYSTGCGLSSRCSSWVSGFVSSSTATTTSNIQTTTVTTQSTCFIANNTNVATPPTSANADTQVVAASASDCCNLCGAKAGCLGFAFLTGQASGAAACWLKLYDPFGSNTPTSAVNYPGMILGALNLAGK